MVKDYEITTETNQDEEKANHDSKIKNDSNEADRKLAQVKQEANKVKQKYSMSRFAWSMIVTGIIVLILLLVFIFQNLQDINVKFFTWEATNIPLGLTLLCAALAGALITTLIASIRMRKIKKFHKQQLKSS